MKGSLSRRRRSRSSPSWPARARPTFPARRPRPIQHSRRAGRMRPGGVHRARRRALLPGSPSEGAASTTRAMSWASMLRLDHLSVRRRVRVSCHTRRRNRLGGGISNGNPVYVAGHVGLGNFNVPARWSLADPTQPTYLPLAAGETFGFAKGVNDAGDAVGSVNYNAAMWLADGTRIPIAAPAGFETERAEASTTPDSPCSSSARRHRTAAICASRRARSSRCHLGHRRGQLCQRPQRGRERSRLRRRQHSFERAGLRAVRWTVDAATGAIVATDVLGTIGDMDSV